jgi:hypothetical protein
MQEHSLDLGKYHFRRTKGDITVIGTWLRDDGRWRPCLVLIRTGDEGTQQCIPCCLTLDRAWIFSDVTGDQLAVLHTVIEFARCLRLDHSSKRDLLRIILLIDDYMSDLISMPPRPDFGQSVILEGEITNTNTGKSRDLIITESG